MMAALPAYNIYYFINNESGQSSGHWWDRSNLYNIDDWIGLVSRPLYEAGISTDPAQVIVGQKNWLFLGDGYENSVSTRRNGPPEGFQTHAEGIVAAQSAWNEWLSDQGVEYFHTIIGPNKNSVYPEYLPGWANTGEPTLLSIIMATDGAEKHIYDPTVLLASTGPVLGGELYFARDTHWTEAGAQLATKALLERAKRRLPGLVLPVLDQEESDPVSWLGDLAAFLHLEGHIPNQNVYIPRVIYPESVDTEQFDLETGELRQSGGNPPVANQQTPLLIQSDNALNNKRVLWMRDSFGHAMSPYMATAFSETVQVHWAAALENDAQLLVELVETWKPDLVFLTAVERSTTHEFLLTMPPD
jgi:hypothetical protein